MTEAQERTLNEIKKQIAYFDFYNNPDGYEIKEWTEYEPHENGSFMVTFTTGMKGDEGTLASCLCRKHRIFWVGVRGGLQVMNRKHHFVSVSIFNLMNKHYFH